MVCFEGDKPVKGHIPYPKDVNKLADGTEVTLCGNHLFLGRACKNGSDCKLHHLMHTNELSKDSRKKLNEYMATHKLIFFNKSGDRRGG